VKLLLDEQISGRVAERLRDQGCDVIAVSAEISLRGLSDPDVFEIAQGQRRAVVTYNRADFEAIVREHAETGREHFGLVIAHPLRFPSHDFARLVKALKRLSAAQPLGKSFLIWLQEDRVSERGSGGIPLGNAKGSPRPIALARAGGVGDRGGLVPRRDFAPFLGDRGIAIGERRFAAASAVGPDRLLEEGEDEARGAGDHQDDPDRIEAHALNMDVGGELENRANGDQEYRSSNGHGAWLPLVQLLKRVSSGVGDLTGIWHVGHQ